MSDISFLTIPVDLRDPGTYVEFDNSKAVGALPAYPRKILILGQRNSGSAVAANVPVRIYKPSDGVKYFGQGSMLAVMITAARTVNDTTEMWAIGLDDNGAGVAQVTSYTFTGPATAAGTATLYVGGTPVQIAVTSGMTAAQAATAMAAAINALPDLPVTATAAAAVVTITVRWKGATGADLDFRQTYYQGDQWPAGLSAVLTSVTAGTTAPLLTNAILAMGSVWYTDVICPYTDSVSLTALAAELERRWGSTVQQDGLIWAMKPASVGTLATLGSSYNEKLLSITGLPGALTPNWTTAATIGAIAAYYGAIDPAAPLDTLALPGILGPAQADRLQHPDRESLLHDGVSTLKYSAGSVIINRLITTYQTNAAGIIDTSYLSVETLTTLAYLRYWIRAYVSTTWPRFKLADDGDVLPVGQRVTTPSRIKASLVAGAQQLVDAGLITDLADFKANLVVQRDVTNPDQVDSILPYKLVRQFRNFAAQIQFS